MLKVTHNMIEALRSAYRIVEKGIITEYDRGVYRRSVLRELNHEYHIDCIPNQPNRARLDPVSINKYIKALQDLEELTLEQLNQKIIDRAQGLKKSRESFN